MSEAIGAGAPMGLHSASGPPPMWPALALDYPSEQMLRHFSRQGRAILLSLSQALLYPELQKLGHWWREATGDGPSTASCALGGRARAEAATSVVGTGRKGREQPSGLLPAA